jgi:hypothetical protein
MSVCQTLHTLKPVSLEPVGPAGVQREQNFPEK